MPASQQERSNPAPIKVIGLGLGRTGTMSLCVALEMLGFGPCYHPMKASQDSRDWFAWASIAEGKSSPEEFDKLLSGYQSAVDSPLAIMAVEVYAAYPNAKFILTTRDPAKWEKSILSTSMVAYTRGRYDTDLPPYAEGAMKWGKSYFDVYHKGRLATDAQSELLKHNEKVKHIIPPEQLLVYEMGEGWDSLAAFLGVPKPDEPFPHLNETAWFQKTILDPMEVISS